MFYDWKTLFQQNHGRLGVAWTAATIGIKSIEKNEIQETNTEKLCDDIIRYVCSNSTIPKQRFSLRLSSMLINGVVKIYREQTTALLNLVVEQLCIVNVPPQLMIYKDDDTVMPKPKKRRLPKTPKPIVPAVEVCSTNEAALGPITVEDLNNLEREIASYVPPPSIAITMPEEPPKITEITEKAEELGCIDDEELRQLLSGNLPVPVSQETPQASLTSTVSRRLAPIIISQIILHEAQVHAPPAGSFIDRQKDQTEEVATVPPQQGDENILETGRMRLRSTVSQTPVVAEVPPHQEEEDIRRLGIDRKSLRSSSVNVREINAESTVSQTAMVAAVPPQQDEADIRRPEIGRKRLRSSPNGREINEESTQKIPEVLPQPKCRIQWKLKCVRKINRCTKYQCKSVKRSTIFLPKLRVLELDATNLLNKYQIAFQEEIEGTRGEEYRSPASKRLLSVPEAIRQGSRSFELSAKRRKTSTDIQTPGPSALPRELTPIHLPSVTQEQKISTAAEVPPLGQPHEEIAVVSEIVPSQILQIDISIPSAEREEHNLQEKRYQDIVNKVASSTTELTIEEACVGPVNRRNIAKTFSDLLNLCKSGYVSLHSDEHCELKSIGKGRKLD